jgi:hypothetical protein
MLHALHPGHPSALAPAFAPRCRGHARDEDAGVDGIMHHAAGSCLVRRQGGQIGEIEIGVAALAYATSCRTRQTVEADRAEPLAADAAKSGTPLHKNALSHTAMIHIIVTNRPIKIGLSVTAAMSLCHCRRHFREKSPLRNAPRRPAQSPKP